MKKSELQQLIREELLNEGVSFQRSLADRQATAKSDYIKLIVQLLSASGVTAKTKLEFQDPTDFSTDSMECEYNGKKFVLKFSNRGYSMYCPEPKSPKFTSEDALWQWIKKTFK